jgi:hypothetical protein
MTSKFVLGGAPFFFFSKKAVNDSFCFFVTSVATGEATRVVGVKLVVALFDFIEISVFFVSTGKGRRVVGGKLVLALFDFTEFGKLVGGGDSLIFGIFIFYFIKIKNIFIELISLKLRT